MAQVKIRDGGRRVEIRDYPPRMRQEDIEHAVRAVLWRMAIGDDPEARVMWARLVVANAPKPRRWGASGPLMVSMAEILACRRVA